jgi:hypothetical protein
MNRRVGALASGLLSMAVAAFAPMACGSPYSDALDARPSPTSDEERRAECAWTRQEMARMQNIAAVVSQQPMLQYQKMQAMVLARQNYAALESHAANVGCTASFGTTTVAPASQGMGFDDCYEKCKKLTERSNGECFDSCKR